MNLKQLEYFVRVSELGSFTQASNVLDIAQPALSRQVRLLEVELRQTLLVRNGRGATTTDAGKVLLGHARGVLHQIERATEEMGRVRGTLAGRVALGIPPGLTKILTVPLIRELRARLPDATLTISDALSVTMQESLVAGRLDIALLFNATPSADVNTFPLAEEDLYLIRTKDSGSTQSSILLRDLPDYPLVIPTRPHALRMIVESELAEIGCRPTIALEISCISSILELVADGAGSAVLSRHAVNSLGKRGSFSLQPIIKPRLRSKISLAVSAQRPATLTQRTVQDLIVEVTQKLLN